MHNRFIVYIILIFSISLRASGADSLWQGYTTAKTDKERIEAIFEIVNNEHHIVNRDSLLDIAIEMAKLNDDNTILVKAYKIYFAKGDIHDEVKALKRAEHLLSIAKINNNNEWFYDGYSAFTRIYLETYQPEVALDHVRKAFYHVNFLPEDSLKAQCMLLYGKCHELNNKKIEALRNYMNALYLAEKSDNKELTFNTYENLSSFFLLITNYERAIYYRKKQLLLLLNNGQVDSFRLMDLNMKFSRILFRNDEYAEAEKITKNVLAYALRNNIPELFKEQSRIFRSHLIEQGIFTKLNDFYTKEYPDELDKLAKDDTVLYYRVKAFITEINGHPDSALWYNEKAEKGIFNEHNIYISNFYKRFGQFYLRQGDIINAINKIEVSYEYAKLADYTPYLIETSNYLDSLHYALGNISEAYRYNKLNKEYIQKQNEINQADEILRLEIDNEVKQQELQKQRKEEETQRRHNLQYMGMIIGIVVCFILLLMLSRYKVHSLLIKSLGFFSFIFFFEFIILLADHKIHHATHGEPWKIMAIKVVLIGILLPLHHWAEEKVVHYLIKRKRVSSHKITVKGTINKIKKRLAEEPVEE